MIALQKCFVGQSVGYNAHLGFKLQSATNDIFSNYRRVISNDRHVISNDRHVISNDRHVISNDRHVTSDYRGALA